MNYMQRTEKFEKFCLITSLKGESAVADLEF